MDIDKIISKIQSGHMNKSDIVDLLYGGSHTDEMTIDFGRPNSFDVEMRANGVNPDWFVWAYKKDGISGGEPLNLAEELINRIMGD